MGVCQEALPESDRGDIQLILSIVCTRLPSHRPQVFGARRRVARPSCDKIPSHKPVVSSSSSHRQYPHHTSPRAAVHATMRVCLRQRAVHRATRRVHFLEVMAALEVTGLGQSQQRRPRLPFNPIWRCNVWVTEWKDPHGGPISQTSAWNLPHQPSTALWPTE